MIHLSCIRRRQVSVDTFRRWRKVAKVTSTHAYSYFDQQRLSLVAQHLFEGKRLRASSLKIKIDALLKSEKNYEL